MTRHLKQRIFAARLVLGLSRKAKTKETRYARSTMYKCEMVYSQHWIHDR